jgi:c-di-GMP-binding flagellar brake protein YcgR
MEEYLPADRLLKLNIGSIVHIDSEDEDCHFTVTLVGVDNNNSIITTLPINANIPEGLSYDMLFAQGNSFEMKTVHEGHIIAFESTITGIYNQRLLIGSFPEMIETRPLRKDTRFPCVLSCDIRSGNNESYGAITNISSGGCQLNIKKDSDYSFIEKSLDSKSTLDLEIFFPFKEKSIVISATVRSSLCEIEGKCMVGLSFSQDYDCIRQYLESLQLDSVAPFFN